MGNFCQLADSQSWHFFYTLKCFVYVVGCYPVAYLAHYSCELQGGELTVFEHCDHLCFVELVFLEREDN